MDATPYLTVKDAAAELGISEDGVRKLIRRQKLRAIKRSERNTLIPRPAFIAYQRKLNGQVAEPLGMATPTGDLAQRLSAFALHSGGQSPAQWLSAWASDEDPGHDTIENMQRCVSAYGLLIEQRAGDIHSPVVAAVEQMVSAVQGS